MSGERLLHLSEQWFRVLVRLYPADFRDEMGDGVVEAYRDRARAALEGGGVLRLVGVWLRALADFTWNGLGERVRPAVRWRRTGNWGRDAEHAVRRLVRAPVFSVATIGTLTVGLGGFAVVAAIVTNVVVAPMPYHAADDLYYVWRDYTAFFNLDRGWLGGTDVAELQKSPETIAGAAAMLRGRMTLSGRAGTDPTEITAIVTTPNLFDLLGVEPMLGRGFAANEIGPDRAPVIVLTHDLWTRLGEDRSILGSELRLNGEPYTVIGVLPKRFAFVRNASLGPAQGADAYTTLNVNLAETNPNAGSYAGLIRARPGTPPERVAVAVNAVARVVDERDFEGRGLKLYPVSLKQDLIAPVRPALIALGFAGVFLVIMLLVNLATLLLTRAAQREREFAVSRALGAHHLAVVRAMLFEGGLLGAAGGAAAVLVAVWGTRALVALAPADLPRRASIAVDWSVAGIVIGTGIVLGVMAAIVPAIWGARTSLATLLGNAAVRGGGGHGRMRRGMVVVQVALSLVLLSAGGLVVRSFEQLLRADPGFVGHGVLTMRVPLPTQLFPDSSAALALQSRVHETLAALPGVSRVGAADALPLTADANQTTIEIAGAPGNTGDRDHDRPLVDYIGVRAGYIETLGMRVLEGRSFDETRRAGVREAIVDRNLATYFFPTGSALGAKIPFIADTLTIVGVVEQARMYDVHRDDRPQLYIRAEDWDYRSLNFALRTVRDPQLLVAEIQSAMRAIDPRLAISDVRTMDAIVDDALRQQRISAVLIAGFAVGALLLAAMGLFGVVSSAVTRRRRELAVRLALGADHGRALRLVLGEGAVLVGSGVLLGLPGLYFAGRVIRGVLVGVSPSDPLTLLAVATALAAVAMIACYLPARRVLRIDPARSLRQE